MIIGIGNDIVEISRIKTATEKTASFFNRIYTDAERAYYAEHHKNIETLAGWFCGKEAVSKALGTGFRGFRPSDIEIIPNKMGKPEITLYGEAKALSRALGITRFSISISHSRDYATAFVVAEGGNIDEVINTSTDECC